MDSGESRPEAGSVSVKPPRRHNILVCQACRHEGQECRPGLALLARLREAIAAAGMGEDFEVSGTVCLAGCSRPCTVAWRANAKATWLFGDIDPEADIDDLVAFSKHYAERHNGWSRAGEWPPSLYDRVLARVPAAMIVTQEGTVQ